MNIFIERSVRSALDFFKTAVFAEEIAASRGLMQSIGPRLKVISFLLLILAVCLARRISVVAALYVLSLALAAGSGINLVFFIKRVWVFIPIFTLFIAIPAVFMHNLYSAALFVLRVAASVSFTVLLTLTTKHGVLLKSLKSLGVPGIFVQVLDMTYRYIFFFIKAFEEMHTSLKARLVKRFDGKEARYWIASRMSFLFRRSVKMGEAVYMAMLARGYTGEAKRHGK